MQLLTDLVRSRETPAGKRDIWRKKFISPLPRPWTERSEGSGRERLNSIFPHFGARPQESETKCERENRSFLGALNQFRRQQLSNHTS